jgi:hypothetical protein
MDSPVDQAVARLDYCMRCGYEVRTGHSLLLVGQDHFDLEPGHAKREGRGPPAPTWTILI